MQGTPFLSWHQLEGTKDGLVSKYPCESVGISIYEKATFAYEKPKGLQIASLRMSQQILRPNPGMRIGLEALFGILGRRGGPNVVAEQFKHGKLYEVFNFNDCI